MTVVFLGTLTADGLEFPIGVHASDNMVAVGNSGGQQCVLLFGPDGEMLCRIGVNISYSGHGIYRTVTCVRQFSSVTKPIITA